MPTSSQSRTRKSDKTTADTQTADTATKGCGCACGAAVSPSASFRPGHDARHAGNTGRALAANPKDRAAQQALDAMSPALRSKAERVRDNAAAKAATKPKATDAA